MRLKAPLPSTHIRPGLVLHVELTAKCRFQAGQILPPTLQLAEVGKVCVLSAHDRGQSLQNNAEILYILFTSKFVK